MRKDIFATRVRRNEAEPFTVVEPFHGARTHVCCSCEDKWRAFARVPELQERARLTRPSTHTSHEAMIVIAANAYVLPRGRPSDAQSARGRMSVQLRRSTA